MSSKKFLNKTCAYCRTQGSSEGADHVVAREFFLAEDRNNLPKVPACCHCNGLKSRLEHYALAVLPLGSQHLDASRYSTEYLAPRLARNRLLHRTLAKNLRGGRWERQRNGLILPAGSVPFETSKITELMSYIVTGLFFYHWGEILDPLWYADVAIIDPHHYEESVMPLLKYLQTPEDIIVRDLGRGTFRYRAIQSSIIKDFSLWEFQMFGGLEFAGDPRFPERSFTNIHAVTRPKKEALAA